jgi:PTH1 family peptidyl-tRNA hydrolase
MLLWKKPGSVSWIIVFLGNPGPKYARTRHNAGFITADLLRDRAGIRIDRLKYKSLTATGELGGGKVFFMKPQTYMNLSGDAVQQAMRFHKVPLERVLVVSDDASLPVGKVRIRRSGSAGGHKGLADIITKCGGEGFPRIKLGVGEPPRADYDMADWVLSAFTDSEMAEITKAAKTALDAAERIICSGVDAAMNEYN